MILTRRERPPIIHNYNNLAGNISQLPAQSSLKPNHLWIGCSRRSSNHEQLSRPAVETEFIFNMNVLAKLMEQKYCMVNLKWVSGEYNFSLEQELEELDQTIL